jgi:4-amino-4-deoxy-L-arabinose transferase-like glycosyltransferase
MVHPLRLTAPAVQKLPRWALWAVLLMYALPGLFGRDPWRGDDATGFGIMWTMATGQWYDWLLPNALGLGLMDPGPATYWPGALVIAAVQGLLPADEAARLAVLLQLAIAAAALWYGLYLLARRADVQPQAMAFGGQPPPRDYGRAVADGGLLLFLASLGLLVNAHQTVMEPFVLMAASGAAFGLIRALDKPWQGAWIFGLCVALLLLSLGAAAALVPVLVAVVLMIAARDWRHLGWHWLVLALLIPAMLMSLWVMATHAAPGGNRYLASWLNLQQPQLWGLRLETWTYYLRNMPWYWWPLWPVACIGLWAWRRHKTAAVFVLTRCWLALGLVYLLSGRAPSQVSMLFLTPPLVLLAGLGLPVLKRGLANLIDWFALLAFSVFAALIWLSWTATMTGWPSKMANNFVKLAPGYDFDFYPLYFAAGLLATLWWAWVVNWRIRSRSVAIWRTAVLSSSGIALVWCLFMTLHLPYVNYLKSYRAVSAQIRAQVPVQACVQADSLGHDERASLAYLHSLRFGRNCDYLLQYLPTPESRPRADKEWRMVWEGRRLKERGERFILYQRHD